MWSIDFAHTEGINNRVMKEIMWIYQRKDLGVYINIDIIDVMWIRPGSSLGIN